jgi:hypothetical protein
LTTISTTYTTKVYPHSTTPAVPEGWTTTVTVYNHKTLTLTRPVKPSVTTQYSSTEVQAVTLTVVPVPAKSGPANPDYNAVSSVAPSFPVKPVANSIPVKAVAESSSVAKPDVDSYTTYQPVYGAAAPTGSWSKTTSGPITQFTGAADRLTVGAGMFVGLVAAVLAL